jgi:hypothetical protein
MTQRRIELEIEGDPIDQAWEEVVHGCLAKDPDGRPQSVSEVAARLEVPSPKTRRAARAAAKKSNKLGVALGLIIIALLVGVGVWYFSLGRRAERSGIFTRTTLPSPQHPEPGLLRKEVVPPATSARTQEIVQAQIAPVYSGTLRVRDEYNSPTRPITIALSPDHKSGTMTQGSKRGDFVVKFSGIWEEQEFHAVTGEVVAQPPGIQWTPESFVLRFVAGGKAASYESNTGGKTYLADLAPAAAPPNQAAARYQGIIHRSGESNGAGVPLTIALAPDRKSGTQTQTSQYGDTVVRFNGIWDGNTLRAVTDEVVSKPKNILWKPESFTLRFADDWKTAWYECNAEGQVFTAYLSAP